MQIQHFFEPRTSTLSYLVYDEPSRTGIVIDPVLDFDPVRSCTGTRSADAICDFAEARRLEIPCVLDTHAHADHMSGIRVIARRFGAKTGIGAGIGEVQKTFARIYDLGPEFPTDGSQFDLLLEDGQPLEAGPFSILPMHTPGHTPACMSYRIGDALFVGDTLFQPDYGTARCDFPGGSAEALYESIQRLYRLPGETRVYTCHDYRPGGRELRFGVAGCSGALQHWRAGNLRWRTGLVFGAAGMAGAYLGGRAGVLLDGGVLLLLFASMMVLTSLAMWRRPAESAGPARGGTSDGKLVAQGLAVGLFTGLVGAGGGFLIVPALALWAGLPMTAAIGTSLFIIVLKSAAGFLGYLSHVSVDYGLITAVTASAIAGSFLGSRLTRVVSPASLRRGFASFVLVMAGLILVREGAIAVATAEAALPATVPQVLFAALMLGIGVLAGRASRAGSGGADAELFERGAGI